MDSSKPRVMQAALVKLCRTEDKTKSEYRKETKRTGGGGKGGRE